LTDAMLVEQAEPADAAPEFYPDEEWRNDWEAWDSARRKLTCRSGGSAGRRAQLQDAADWRVGPLPLPQVRAGAGLADSRSGRPNLSG